jgi:gas vesicle protein
MPFRYWKYRYDTTDLMTAAAAGFVLGALAMFILDPDQGRRRRALARDKMVRYGNDVGDFVSSTAKDLSNRAYGIAKETQGAAREQLGIEGGAETPGPAARSTPF